MLHRVVKKNDVNKDKWIGVGGHFEYAESPEECLLREVKEETGYTLTSWKYRGIVTFVYGEDVVEYMSLYTADGFTGDPIECDEGVLEWGGERKDKGSESMGRRQDLLPSDGRRRGLFLFKACV